MSGPSVAGVVLVGGHILGIGGGAFTIGGTPALLFTPAPLPEATDGVAYSQLITFSNGTGPFTLLAGPSWMTITAQNSSTSCTVGGTPTGSGTFTVTFESTT
jgi:large repetitive protein